MAVAKSTQTNFTSGVLDPKLAAREDTAFYYNGLKDGKNLIIMPQGGGYARPGMQFVKPILKELDLIDLSGATITAPNGGTAGSLIDDDVTTRLVTNNLSTTNPFVIFHVDFIVPRLVSAVDIIDYFLGSGVNDDEFIIQYSQNNAIWTAFGKSFDWDATPRSRRRRAVSGNVEARYLRLVRIGSTDIPAAAHISEIKFWVENAEFSNVRMVPFAYSTDEAYMMGVTGGNMDVFTGFDYQGSIAISHVSDELPTIGWTQSLDTLLLFHKNIHPLRVFRQGADDEFDFRNASFDNIPQYDYGAGVGGVDEVQTLNFDGIVSGDKFTLLLEGRRTQTITHDGTAAPVQAALRALSNTSNDGITVSYSASEYTVTFGGDDGKQPWDEMSVSVLGGNSVFSVSRITEGEYPGEDIMSDERGWPRCGLFHQARLHLGGLKSLPDCHLMSVINERYNFDMTRDDDTKALQFRAETDQVGAIYNIVAGRNVSLFTNDGEFYYSSGVIKDDAALQLTTRSGSKEGLRVHEIDGALLYVQGVKDDVGTREIGTSIREFIYEETQQSYSSNLISKLSSHLIKDPVDSALRKGLSTDDADILLLINKDGEGVAFTVLRNDLVNAFMPIATREGDRFLAVGVDKKRRVYFAVERTINGVKKQFYEMWNKDLLLDCGDIVTITAQSVVATSDEQQDFFWTFTNPALAAQIGVRLNGAKIEDFNFTVHLGTKTVSFNPAFSSQIKQGDVVRIASMVSQISGLEHLEGESLHTVVDGTQGDILTVNGGVLDLGLYADTEIQYGFDFEVSGSLMPLRVPEQETLSNTKVRVVNALFELYQTGGIEFKANDREWREISLIKTDDEILDRSTAELLFTGTAPARGLLGNSIGAPLEFRRPGPTPFTILGVTREVSL